MEGHPLIGGRGILFWGGVNRRNDHDFFGEHLKNNNNDTTKYSQHKTRLVHRVYEAENKTANEE